jgi:BolA protein
MRGGNTSETHFHVQIVSAQFEGKIIIERHRIVNAILAEELKGSVHALQISAKTPNQYNSS